MPHRPGSEPPCHIGLVPNPPPPPNTHGLLRRLTAAQQALCKLCDHVCDLIAVEAPKPTPNPKYQKIILHLRELFVPFCPVTQARNPTAFVQKNLFR